MLVDRSIRNRCCCAAGAGRQYGSRRSWQVPICHPPRSAYIDTYSLLVLTPTSLHPAAVCEACTGLTCSSHVISMAPCEDMSSLVWRGGRGGAASRPAAADHCHVQVSRSAPPSISASHITLANSRCYTAIVLTTIFPHSLKMAKASSIGSGTCNM